MSRRLGAFSVLLLSQPLAVIVFLPIVFAVRGGPPEQLGLLYAVGAGVATIVSAGSFYRAMTIGKISLVAPIASCGAVLPLAVGLIFGERPAALQLWGIPLALIGVALVSIEPDRADRKVRLVAGVGLAALSSLATGAFALFFREASAVDPYWAALVARITMLILLAAIAAVLLARHRPVVLPGRSRWHIAAVTLAGILGVTGDLLFGAATTEGLLSVVSVIASMFPLVTVGLAMIVLRERVVGYQATGVVSALVGVALLSTA